MRVGLFVLVASVALTTGACSGSSGGSPANTPSPMSSAAYTAQLKTLSQQEAKSHHDVETALQASSVGQVRSALTAFASDQDRAAGELRSLTPPANAQAANSALAKAFADNAAALRQIVQQLSDVSSVKAALQLIQQAKGPQQAGQEIDSALKQLKQLGYTSGS